jgi:hypothetical protein
MRAANGHLAGGAGEIAVPPFDSLPAERIINQDWIGTAMVGGVATMVAADQLSAIVTAVVGALIVLSMLWVPGGYFILAR